MILTVSDSTNAYLQFMTVLILFVFILVITFWVTKWIAGYQKGRTINKNMELIETFQLTNNKYIQIIRVGQKYLAVAIGKDSVTMLAEVPEEELILSSDDGGAQAGFKELFEKVQKKNFSGKKDDRNKSE